MKKIVLDLRGKELEEAKEILTKEGIKYEDKTKEVLSFIKKGKVANTKPKKNTEIDTNNKVIIQVSQGPFFLILAAIAILVGVLSFTLGTGVFRSIVGQTVITGKMKAPKVDISKYKDKDGNPIWEKDTIIQVENPGTNIYEYCVKDTKDGKCNWETTETNNIIVAENGHKYVEIREVDKDGNKGPITELEVFIDNNNPIINKVDIEKVDEGIKVVVTATDEESGLENYYYSTDGENWAEDETSHIFDTTDIDKIHIKVTDKVGNEVVVIVDIDKVDIDNPTTPTNPTNPDNPTNPGVNWDVPKINLSKVPTIFTYGDFYELPTFVDFGNDTGAYGCLVDGKSETNTSTLKVGPHFIECTAISDHAKQTMVIKNIMVNPLKGDNEVMDGWIRLNLSYPTESTNRQWRLNKPNNIRTYNDSWKDYVGPILVRIRDIENVYIRYDLDGETYIIAPNGEVAVSIEPENWILREGTTKVRIYYDRLATVKKYRINNGEWKDYNGEFEVEVGTKIDALVEKQEKLYDNNGNYIKTKTYSNYDSVHIALYTDTNLPENWGSNGNYNLPPVGSIMINTPQVSSDMVLEGPTITSNPNTGIVESTVVSITTDEPGIIYYKENDGNYKKYTGSFTVTQNETISAYYYRDSDGKKSKISTYRVSNIRVGQIPYVSIIAEPSSYLTEDVDKVNIKIVASDYDLGTLVYSLDGIIYKPYVGSFEVIDSTTIYAKATNTYGEGKDVLTITTKNTPKELDKLDIFITVNPSKQEVQGLINSAEVSINYDTRATKKYYSLDGDNWLEYTGSFEITSNTAIYAYATCDNGKGYTSIGVDYLTTGIMKPIIQQNTDKQAYQVKIDIDYDQSSSVKKYRIDNGQWLDYVGSFYVYENCTIYAYNENSLGYSAQSSKYVSNIVPRPDIVVLDEGMYYLIRLNYPSSSRPSDREYKYKENGAWKTYDEKGIYLIKPEYKDEMVNNENDVIILDSKGNKITLTDHYYFLDQDVNSAVVDIFMRWEDGILKKPKITLDTEEPTQKVRASITYTSEAVTKEYKLVYNDGTSTEWLPYTGEFEIDKVGTYIYARGVNIDNLHSEMASLKVNNIDKVNPTIAVYGDFTTKRYSINVTVSASDNFMIKQIKYAKGSHDTEYFKDVDDTLPNNGVIKIEENDVYTFYVIDQAGNETVKEINVNNIDKDMPNISIDILTKKLSSIVKLKIGYGDSVTKQYKIGKNTTTYTNYPQEDEITLTSYDHYTLANTDGSITVCARGVRSNGKEGIVCEDIYVLDTVMINAPVINDGKDYPVLTSDGFDGEGLLTVTYDNRDDIINEICLVGCDNQENWSRYTGSINYTVGTVKARSKKIESGLTLESSKDIKYKENSISYDVIDNSTSSFMEISANTTKMFEVNTRDTLTIRIQSDAQGGAVVKTYNGTRLTSTKDIDDTTKDINILPGTTKVEITTGNSSLILYEIVLTGRKTSYMGDSILSILQDNDLDSGNYYFIANDILYPVHLYTYDGDQVWNSNSIPMPDGFGNAGDVGTASSYAQNMVIVKVNGDLTNNTVIKPYSTEYGGPKGFLLYVTGKLTNNGTIDNSHGAYAEGENVYLWKNALTNNYEYIPATGANGAQGARNAGKLTGGAGTGRQTGGGGAGDTYLSTNGNGGKGTSYSGGSGSGLVQWEATGNNASDVGGQGGNGYHGKNIGSAGGTGNPGGQGGTVGTNGTGGLLIIYSNEFDNQHGTISANGTKAVNNAGSSGGGSINIFTNQSPNIHSLGTVVNTKYQEMLATTSVVGGGYNETDTGIGGTGTVNIGGIRNGQYYDLKEIIQQDIDAYIESITKRGDSILSIIDNTDLPEGEYYYFFIANGEKYPVHLYVFDGDQEWSGTKVFGDAADCATGETEDMMAKNMVIVKVNGNLTNNGTIRPFYNTTYGGPKGFTLYVTGDLINRGTIDNSHGAYAARQDVYLWKNSDGTYETVPGTGANGARGARNAGKLTGSAGTGRQTGGGGAGDTYLSTNGNGGKGTSYSGGSGSGQVLWEATGNNASDLGGRGGTGYNGKAINAAGGTGNPGGYGATNALGTNGTGGLLVIYANGFKNVGTLSANGTKATTNAGSSGGGSINIFMSQPPEITSSGTPIDSTYSAMLGTTSVVGGGYNETDTGVGGNGTVNIGGFKNGKYYDLKEIIRQEIAAYVVRENLQDDISAYINADIVEGDSILSILNNNDFTNGYYNFKTNGKTYLVHLYNYNGDQEWFGTKVFGEPVDCAKSNQFAQAMVIVKVNGNLTNNGTIRPAYNETYGGPKGFLLYVTGDLVNRGTIDNSHGAYAAGEDVYLWKKANGSYEFVPAGGASGGAGGKATTGKAGTDGTGRQTGGGGGGAGEYGKSGGSGTDGTSYSGGSAGGGGNYSTNGTSAADNGGAGGNGGHEGGGGAGNPGGNKGANGGNNGGNGTGGLLIIYASTYTNSGTISATGTVGGTSRFASGGSSGGGSINIFYQTLGSKGTKVYYEGGAAPSANYKGGKGGSGTVTYTEITMPTRSRSASPKRAIAYIAPLMEIDTLDLVTTKLLTITYQDGYRGEYSLDLGETWLEYKEGIYVEENTTILARTVDSEGNIVRTSSFTITTIKKEDVVTTPPLNNNTGKDETDDQSGNEVINPDGGDDDE